MSFLENIIFLIGKINLDSNTFDEELTQKMKLMNVVVLLTAPVILIAIFYLYFFIGNIEKALAISAFLFTFVLYLFLKGNIKKYLHYFNIGFFLSFAILVANIIAKQKLEVVGIEEYILPKITLIIAFIAVAIFIPISNKKVFYPALFFNILIYFSFEYLLNYFGVDYFTKGNISEISSYSYSNIVFMFNLNYIIIIILFFMHQILAHRTSNRLKYELRKFRNTIDKYKDENNSYIQKIKSFTNELDSNSHKLKWLNVLINKSIFYYVLKFDSKNTNYLIENSSGNIDEDLDIFTFELFKLIDKNQTITNLKINDKYIIDYIPNEKEGKLDKAYIFINNIS